MLANDSQYWVGSGWVNFFHLQWVGLGWVSQLMAWVGSGHIKWNHGQLCNFATAIHLLLTYLFTQVVMEKRRYNGCSNSSSSQQLQDVVYKMCVCCIITGASAVCESAVPQCRRLHQPSRRLRTHHHPPIHLSSRIRRNQVTSVQQFARLPHRYGNSHATWDHHTVLPATRQR